MQAGIARAVTTGRSAPACTPAPGCPVGDGPGGRRRQLRLAVLDGGQGLPAPMSGNRSHAPPRIERRIRVDEATIARRIGVRRQGRSCRSRRHRGARTPSSAPSHRQPPWGSALSPIIRARWDLSTRSTRAHRTRSAATWSRAPLGADSDRLVNGFLGGGWMRCGSNNRDTNRVPSPLRRARRGTPVPIGCHRQSPGLARSCTRRPHARVFSCPAVALAWSRCCISSRQCLSQHQWAERPSGPGPPFVSCCRWKLPTGAMRTRRGAAESSRPGAR